ncbi:MAG: RAMP superfamily CRISPR-associated protein [Cyanobacteriota bacterium]|jgi:CRISPR-associated protein Cmr4
MYHKAYGVIETLAPLHVGASAGEETGNLNLIFRDQFTQTGIIPGSSIRGRFRADMREEEGNVDKWYGKQAKKKDEQVNDEDTTSEGIVKFEYASLLWLPVYCPNQPIVRVTCPIWLNRYLRLKNQPSQTFTPYSYFGKTSGKPLFFNLGFLPLKKHEPLLKKCMPDKVSNKDEFLLLVVDNTEISMIHDMALYRQSRVSLEKDKKKAKKGAFFDVEALPEGSVLTFPIALRKHYESEEVKWTDFESQHNFSSGKEMYFGGLESIGFGRTQVFCHSISSNH